MKSFKDLQGNQYILSNVSMLDENTYIGFVVGSGLCKIYNKSYLI